MSKPAKTATIIAICLLSLGLLICTLVMVAIRWDIQYFSHWFPQEDYQRTEYLAPAEDVKQLHVEDISFDLHLRATDTDQILVSYVESDLQNYEINLDEQGMLRIVNRVLRRKGPQFWFGFQSGPDTDLYIDLPRKLAADLEIDVVSSDIHCNGLHTTGGLDITTASGDLSLMECRFDGGLSYATASGDLYLDGTDLGNTSRLLTVSGDILLREGLCGGPLEIETTSGEIDLEHLEISDDLQIRSISGDMDLDAVSAQDITLESTSGDIEGNLIGDPGEYRLHSDTTSGDIHAPHCSGSRYTLKVDTVSGDVELDFYK